MAISALRYQLSQLLWLWRTNAQGEAFIVSVWAGLPTPTQRPWPGF